MPITAPQMQRKRVFKELLEDEDSFATTLVTLFIDTYGTEALAWDPETIAIELEDDFQADLPAENFDKLMVAIQLLTTDEFYHLLPEFNNVCNILSGDTFDPNAWDPADSDELAWGITEGMLLAPSSDSEPFTKEIRAYIGEVLDREGIINPPDVLRIALRGDEGLLHNVPEAFSDDPVIYEAIYKFEQDKTNEIVQILQSNIRQLVAQLERLPLVNGDAKDALNQLLKVMKG